MKLFTQKPSLQLKNGVVVARQARRVTLVPLNQRTVTLATKARDDGRFEIIAQSGKDTEALLSCGSEQEANRVLDGLNQPRLLPSIRTLVLLPVIMFVGWFLFLLPTDDSGNLLPTRAQLFSPPQGQPAVVRSAMGQPASAQPAQTIALPARGSDPLAMQSTISAPTPQKPLPAKSASPTTSLSAFGLQQ